LTPAEQAAVTSNGDLEPLQAITETVLSFGVRADLGEYIGALAMTQVQVENN
jgi:hypothetical protein